MTELPETEHHEVLGALLRELPVPDHGPRFHAELRERLAGRLPARDRLRAEVDAEETFRPGRFRRRLPGRARSQRPRHVLRWGLGVAAAAITAVAVLLVAIGLPGTEPEVATAAQVRATVSQAWASAERVSGDLVVESGEVYGPGERRWAFILTTRGDFRLTDLTRGGEVAYDAGRGVERSLSVSESIQDEGQLFASERRGLAPGLPDQGPSTSILDRNLGSVVRALAAGGGGSVREVMYRGRPAWLLDTDIRASLLEPELSPNHLQVTVDRQTGFPVRVVATHDGRLVYETRLEGLRVDPPLSEDAFRIEFPPGVEVHRSDERFRRVSLDRAAEIVGYDPLVPAWVPEGYELSEVAVSTKPSFTGTEGGNPAVPKIVSLSYRRGLDQFLVTIRPVGGDPSAWSDPLSSGEGFVDEPESVVFSGGILGGRTGQLLIDPLSIPHVWGMTEDLVITVSGDLTRAELLRVAGSLE